MAVSLSNIGSAHNELGQYEDALQYLQRAYERFPDPEVAAHLGEVLWVIGDTAGARGVWREALQKDPQHKVLTSTLQRLGVTGLQTGS